MSSPAPRVLSDVVVELGFVSRETVEEAVRAAQSPGTTLAGVLMDKGALTEEQLARATAERHGIEYVDLSAATVDAATANLIKPSAARRYEAVPVAEVDDALLVAMADPADTLAVEDIAAMTKRDVRPAVTARPALEALLEALPLGEEAWTAEPAPPAPPADEPAEDPAPEDSTPDAPTNGADASRLRHELDALKQQLSGAEAKLRGERPQAVDAEVEELRGRLAAAEAELEEARVRVRESKEVWAEVDTLREKLQAAQAGLDHAGAEELRGELSRMRHERDYLRSELRRVGADTEVRTGELESLRTKLTEAETELVRVRADADARGAELEALRIRTETAEQATEETVRRASDAEERADMAERRASEAEREADTARHRVAELEHEVAASRRLADDLAAAEARADQAREELGRMRDEREREREQAAMTERDLRGKLAEVEGAAAAAERSLEELRLAQRRIRTALGGQAEADRPDAG